MTKREVKSVWNIEGMRESLQGAARVEEHEQHGMGARIDLGDTGTTMIIFPQSGLVYARTKNSQHEMYGMVPALMDEHGVVFEGTEADRPQRLWISPGGEVITVSVPYALATPAQHRALPEAVEPAPALAATPPATPLTEGAPLRDAPAPTPERRRRERGAPREVVPKVTLFGNIGKGVRFRQTAKGRLLAEFELGEHPDQETTIWRKVLAFDDKARDLQATPLRRGEPVEVIAYPHQRKVQTRDGRTQLVEEFYVWKLTRR